MQHTITLHIKLTPEEAKERWERVTDSEGEESPEGAELMQWAARHLCDEASAMMQQDYGLDGVDSVDLDGEPVTEE